MHPSQHQRWQHTHMHTIHFSSFKPQLKWPLLRPPLINLAEAIHVLHSKDHNLILCVYLLFAHFLHLRINSMRLKLVAVLFTLTISSPKYSAWHSEHLIFCWMNAVWLQASCFHSLCFHIPICEMQCSDEVLLRALRALTVVLWLPSGPWAQEWAWHVVPPQHSTQCNDLIRQQAPYNWLFSCPFSSDPRLGPMLSNFQDEPCTATCSPSSLTPELRMVGKQDGLREDVQAQGPG